MSPCAASDFSCRVLLEFSLSVSYSLPGSPACTPCTGRPHSGGSQFFMNLTHNPRLDWFSPGASKHPVFGQITEGFDIAMEISEVSTARQPRTRSSLHRALTVQSAVHRPCTDRAHNHLIPSDQCVLLSTHTPHISEVPTTGDNPNTPIMMKKITISGL